MPKFDASLSTSCPFRFEWRYAGSRERKAGLANVARLATRVIVSALDWSGYPVSIGSGALLVLESGEWKGQHGFVVDSGVVRTASTGRLNTLLAVAEMCAEGRRDRIDSGAGWTYTH